MLRQRMLELLESHSRQLKNMGVYIAVIMVIFSISIPVMGRQIAQNRKTTGIGDIAAPAVEEEAGPKERKMEILPVAENQREQVTENTQSPVKPQIDQEINSKEENKNIAEIQYRADINNIIWPVKGEIIQHFGLGYSRTFSDYRFHNGIDIKVKMGTEVRAVLPGKVVKLETDKGHGKLCLVDHGLGWQSMYSHLDEVYVKTGDSLKPGQILGSVGQPGLNEILEGPHLHFSLYKDNKEVNPQDYLPKL